MMFPSRYGPFRRDVARLPGRMLLETLAAESQRVLANSLRAFADYDAAIAREVIAAKEDVNRIAERIGDRLIARLVAEDPHRTSTFRVESQLIEHFERIYYFARRIAKLVAEADTVDDRAQPEREAAA